MKHIYKKFQTGCMAVVVTLLATFPAVAEDIEIYQSGNLGTATVSPNILLILDNSGSMGEKLDITPVYDPDTDYSALGGNCFDPDKMYASVTSDVKCTAQFKDSSFLLSQNQCQRAKDAFAVTGMYNSVFAQWNSTKNFWGLLKERTIAANYIECRPDQGVHGKGGADTYISLLGTSSAYTADATDSTTNWSTLESESLTLYTGNWMNYKVANLPMIESTRFEVMQLVMNNLLYSIDGVNIGLMNFNFHQGGAIRFPISDITNNREALRTEINSWDPSTWTPLSETLYEAYLYFSGGAADYGIVGAVPFWDSSTSSVSSAFIDGDRSNNYQSPVDSNFGDCQKQFIIYLSDGEPTEDVDANTNIESLTGFVNTAGNKSECIGGNNDGACLDDLAGYMNNYGFIADMGDGTTVPTDPADPDAENITVNTFTVGFTSELASLKNAAREGGGEYFTALNATELLTTLTSIITAINQVNTTFSSPAVSVNAFNRTVHRNELYFTLFKPETAPHWDGNFKRFKLAFIDGGIPEIQDANNVAAVSAATGFFKEDATSFWTDPVDAPLGDGRDTSLGGAASKFFNGTPYSAGRKIYTDVRGTGILNETGNRVWRASPGVREAMGWDGDTSDVGNTNYYNNLVDWVRGIDVDDDDKDNSTTDARRVMGDPLHAQPALVQYGGTDSNPDITAYVATNDGLLHAISTRDGVEQFAFLPTELLPRMKALYENIGGRKFYGLDGTVVPYIIDNDKDGIIEPGDGDKVYLYFGMRRGGSNIYALDVTDRDDPRLMWTIRGGPDALGVGVPDTSLGDYSHLGQTWSKPSLRIIKLGGNDVPVLIFGAGYDTDQDSVFVRTADSIGQGIYIVNAMTGEPMWRMGPDAPADLTAVNMQYSIPSDVSAVDTDGDGLVDHLYVGDMGGQLWRVDINNTLGQTVSNIKNIITGGRIADLADADIEGNRRFYYPPSVAIDKDDNDKAYTALILTSGYRAHPTDKDVQDKIFMIRDTPVNGAPTTYETLVVNNSRQDLYDATANIIGQGAVAAKETARISLNGLDGWFVDLDKSVGEKGLTKALIFAGDVFLTTYVPYDGSTTTASCKPNEGSGYLYHFNLFDAKPVKNYDTIVSTDATALTKEDRRVKLDKGGIPADPTIITTKEGSARCVGTECTNNDAEKAHVTIYWFEDEI